jgi:hypothetical protein
MELLSPGHFPDYELIDCGNFEKLERFGKYVTIRPEPQALWDPVLSDKRVEQNGQHAVCPKVIFNRRLGEKTRCTGSLEY